MNLLLRKLRDKIYYYKCKFFHPYNVIKLKSLPPTWTDKDYILEQCIETIFKDFIEKEKPFEHFDTEKSHNKKEWREINKIYDWLTVIKPNLEKNIDLALDAWYDTIDKENMLLGGDKGLLKKHTELEKDLEKQKTEIYKRIIELRGHYWT